MENASKALIIAGAILLSILIIGLGMLVFNQAREALSGANLDAEKANAFNSKFSAYEGSSVRGSQVRSLIDIVRDNNETLDANATDATAIKITLGTDVDKTSAADLSAIKNKITLSGSYTVAISQYTKGYITAITITKNP